MRSVMRWLVIVVVMVHGVIHLLGAAKGFGWADVTQLREPISMALGVAWLGAAMLVIVAGVLLLLWDRRSWVAAGVAAIVSEGVILSSWSDAKAGTVANVILLGAAVYGFASQGPTSYRAEFRRRAGVALTGPRPGGVVTEADLAHLPEPVAAYVRRTGAVGKPRVTNVKARIRGRIRAGATSRWMSFTGEQLNTYGPEPTRLFFLDATMFGLPVDVLHTFVGPSATMRVKACSLVPIVSTAGPDMDRAETVTLFNDLCILAPAALIDAQISWRLVDVHHVSGAFTNGAHTVSAELLFNEKHDLVDFVSNDRLRASRDGKSFTRQRWSTPVHGYRTMDSRRISTKGEARWHASEPEGEFAYIQLDLDKITYNVPAALTESTRIGQSGAHAGVPQRHSRRHFAPLVAQEDDPVAEGPRLGETQVDPGV